jgi:small-conductance mechanosensitive channel
VITIIFSAELGGLTVALGVAGAAIAFALQEAIVSIAGWFAISFAYFFKTGDRVKLGGIKGDVIDIGMLRSTIMEVGDWVQGDLCNGRIVRMSNSFVFKEPVFNYSCEFPFLWDKITVPITYGSDVKSTRTILIKLAMSWWGNMQNLPKNPGQSWSTSTLLKTLVWNR